MLGYVIAVTVLSGFGMLGSLIQGSIATTDEQKAQAVGGFAMATALLVASIKALTWV